MTASYGLWLSADGLKLRRQVELHDGRTAADDLAVHGIKYRWRGRDKFAIQLAISRERRAVDGALGGSTVQKSLTLR